MSCNLIQIYRTSGFNYDSVAIGTLVNGGYYAGKINIDGLIYALLVSPAAGLKNGLDFKNANTTDGTILQNTYDGLKNCQAVNDANHPMVQWALSQTFNGKNDWYIPARDELEIVWRNLSVDAIGSGATGLLSPQGQLGDPASGVYNGYNAHSIPAISGYNTLQRTPMSSSPVPFNEESVWGTSTEVTATPGQCWGVYTARSGSAAGKFTNFSKQGYAGNANFGYRLIRRDLIGPA